MSVIHYQVCPKFPETHLFQVRCIIQNPHPEGQKFALPAWIPGSYLIRDFAKNVIDLKAYVHDQTVALTLLDKNTWQAESVQGPLVLTYSVYAFDLTPRGIHLDNTHAFFNGARLFMRILGQEQSECLLDILPPIDARFNHWHLASGLPKKEVNAAGFGQYFAKNYDDLIDYPVEMGSFEIFHFDVVGIPHTLTITGGPIFDYDRLVKDLTKLCEYHILFFGKPPPFKNYLFLLTIIKGGYGGLEHQNSTALHASMEHLPRFDEPEISDGYRTLLGLFSHEYFHAWNVKAIKPEAFFPYDLNRENYTKLLWVFEGLTSYYDELALLRSGLITAESYFELIGQLMTRVHSVPGRYKQTLEQSSFLAWTTFYQADENALNATVNYYTKGALVGLALDLTLRKISQGAFSLDHIMRALWLEYGEKNKPLSEEGFEQLVSRITGFDLTQFFDLVLRDTQELPLAELLNAIGIELIWQDATSVDELGGKSKILPNALVAQRPLLEVKLKPRNTDVNINFVWAESAAEKAGLAPHDVIIAVNNMKVDRQNFEATIARFKAGETVKLHVFRRDELMTFDVVLRSGWLKLCVLKRMELPNDTQQKLLQDWLMSNEKFID